LRNLPPVLSKNKGGKNKRMAFARRIQREEPYNVNERIRAQKVRVVGEGFEPVVLGVREAIDMAKGMSLDLVEISPNADPPVCRIVDYSKFKYEQKKKQKELKAKQHKVVLKEIRFSPNTDDHDFDFKKKHAISFLKEGNKVKAYVHFVGRSIVYKDRGEQLLQRFAAELEEVGKVEERPRLEGKRMYVIFTPKAAATAAPAPVKK
jgi:translation initiation factor IF-3